MPRRSNGLVDFSRQVIWPLGALILFLVLLQLSPLPLKNVFMVLFTAVLLSAAISPAARLLRRYHIPRGVTVLMCYVLMLLLFAAVFALLVPLIVDELISLESALPQYALRLQNQLNQVAPSLSALLSPENLAVQVTSRLAVFASTLTDLAFTIVSTSVNVVIVLVLAYFMAAEENFARLLISRFVPLGEHTRIARLMGRTGTRMGEWARAQLLLALFFGVVFGAGLKVAGVHYAITLGFIGGILEVIPYVGGFITLVVASLVAVTQRPILVVFVLVWYFIVVELESHVIAPKLMNRVLGIHPLVVVLALFLGAESLGILGALLAVPMAIVIQVLLDEFYSPGRGPASGPPAPPGASLTQNGQHLSTTREPAEKPSSIT
jgi:predicted PurR-regulated permease PerM